MANLHILGIRHHGVGSARYVMARLAQIQPDYILVESPPELDPIVRWIGDPNLTPPVSVLCYDQNLPQEAGFYPFAEFSPEWQAILYANQHKIPVQMMDLPIALTWEIRRNGGFENTNTGEGHPLAHFAQIAGYSDTDLWWEHTFEQHFLPDQAQQHFEAVGLAMRTLRAAQLTTSLDAENVAREAYMTQLIEAAEQKMYQNIAVICGAWHAPALEDRSIERSKEAYKILKSLPKTKIKVGVTWIPWTNDRLGFASGYGAGIQSPGFSTHQWNFPNDQGEQWLAKVAALFRAKKMDISTAHVIEAFRLGQALAGLRGLARVGLPELNEATQSVMCMGEPTLMNMVKNDLTVGQSIGQVPDNLPKLPLQMDFDQCVKNLKLKQEPDTKEMPLDLRKPLDLARSVFFHRLATLDIHWAKPTFVRNKGTFKEGWKLNWSPEMVLLVIEKGIYGNSIQVAANQFLIEKYKNTPQIAELATAISAAIPAELFEAIDVLLTQIDVAATLGTDSIELMETLIPLVEVQRYGNVRNTDLTKIETLVERFLTRIVVNLPTAAYGLDDPTSTRCFVLIRAVHQAVQLLDDPQKMADWTAALLQMVEKDGIHGIIRGSVTRLLSDAQRLDKDQIRLLFGRTLSKGNSPQFSAAYIEGFLKGSGMILMYDDKLWNLLYAWLEGLEKADFVELLPILRRTFATFERNERRQLGEKAKQGIVNAQLSPESDGNDPYFDPIAANNMLDAVLNWL